MKYIDADKLKKLIDEKWKELADKGVKVGGGKYEIEIYTYLSVLRLIDSLQQEQPGVDLEKTVEFECIGKKVKMTVQELINYYIDSECVDVADECGF